MRRKTRVILIVLTILIGLLAFMSGPLIGAVELPPEVKRHAWLFLVPVIVASIGLTVWQVLLQTGTEPSAVDTRAKRRFMLDRVTAIWIAGFLENPLNYDEQLLPLPLRERVGSRYDLALYDPLEPAHSLPPDKKILDVFDDARGQLLILGEPGAGKTTLLLELARDLLQGTRPPHDEAPIPVVLTLSSWATKQLPLEQWVINELKTKHRVPTEIGQAWVENNQLLLLLDGLDEVAPHAQPACIRAVNSYIRQVHRSLVVCSRTNEYLEQTERLSLRTAVAVQPLSPQQVDDYLSALGEEVDGLKRTLQQSEPLSRLATTPLLLKVLILAYHGKSAQDLLSLVNTTPTGQQHLLFHDYVEKMLQLKGPRMQASKEDIKRWLAWLTQQLTAHNQTELYLEYLQPDWLPEKQRSRYSWSICLLGGLVLGLLFVPLGLELGGGLVLGLFFGLFFGLLHGQYAPEAKIELAEGRSWSWRNALIWLLGGLVLGLLFVLFTEPGFGLFDNLTFGLFIWGLGFGSLLVPLGGLSYGLSLSSAPQISIKPAEARSWSWRNARNGLLFGLGLGLLGGLLVGLTFGLLVGPGPGLLVGLLGGLLVGLVLGLPLGLLFGLSRKLLPKGQPLSPNEGIRRSATYGLLFVLPVLGFGLLVALLGGLVQELITVPLYGPNRGVPAALTHHGLLDALVSWLSIGMPFGLLFGLAGVLAGVLLFGPGAAVQHSILRLWLWQAGCTPAPWQYVAFLDDTVEQLLLRKVGGGYVFRHRLLQDYFASLDAVPPHDPSVRADARSVLQNAPNGGPSV